MASPTPRGSEMEAKRETGRALAASAPADWARCVSSVLEGVEEAALLLDPQGTVLSWNGAAQRILGWSAEEMLGRSVRLLVPEERLADMHRIEAELVARGRVRQFDSEALAKDGRRIPVRLTESRLDGPDGVPAGFSLILRDLSERLEMERQILRADRLATIGLLASSVAHEVGTPLNVILGRAEMLAETLHDNPEAQRQIAAISAQIQRISSVVSRLLTFSREATPGDAPVALNHVVEEVFALVELRARTQRIRLEADLAPDLPALAGNAGHFHQIFLNLVMNALDAMPRGGALQVTTRQCRGAALATGVGLSCCCLQIEVRDSGQGIAPEILGRIFEPFFTTKPGTKGTGLGLAITHELVGKYGGQIEVESEPGHGTRFRVNLPLAPRGLPIVS